MIEIIQDISRWTEIRDQLKIEGKSIGFVPTMGALHEGHLSLVKKSLKETQVTLISIFVNPTQFNKTEDLKNYPSELTNDIKKLQEVTKDSKELHFLLLPDKEQIYPDNYNFKVFENKISPLLCGKDRPGHFQGVMTVVLKLLNIAGAKKSYFGEKDYQQLQIIKKMAEAFFIPTEIVGCPIVRETSGLALSSRNLNLTKEKLVLAKELFKTISSAKSKSDAKKDLSKKGFEVDYVEEQWGRRFVAAQLEGVRLIDNVNL